MDFKFEVIGVGMAPTPGDQLAGIHKYLKEWGDYSPDAFADVVLCVAALYECVNQLETICKDQAEKIRTLEGFRTVKRKDVKTTTIEAATGRGDDVIKRQDTQDIKKVVPVLKK